LESGIAHPELEILLLQLWKKAYSDRQAELYCLKTEPPFEPLYTDTRWQQMLDKVGFPE